MQSIQTNKNMFHKEILKLCNTDENRQPENASLDTVGCVYNRYRLVHRWMQRNKAVYKQNLIAVLGVGGAAAHSSSAHEGGC